MISTPVTAFYAGVLAIIVLLLALRVVQFRRSSAIGLGDGGNELLFRRIRIHGNAVEYLPTALILMLILELNGASHVLLHALGIALVAGRLAILQGLTVSAGVSPGRLVGNVLTWAGFLVGALRAMSLGLGLG
jgi:uncharacterized membrane protein YecN with MAPEG domain